MTNMVGLLLGVVLYAAVAAWAGVVLLALFVTWQDRS